jgi:hypothetical protein
VVHVAIQVNCEMIFSPFLLFLLFLRFFLLRFPIRREYILLPLCFLRHYLLIQRTLKRILPPVISPNTHSRIAVPLDVTHLFFSPLPLQPTISHQIDTLSTITMHTLIFLQEKRARIISVTTNANSTLAHTSHTTHSHMLM